MKHRGGMRENSPSGGALRAPEDLSPRGTADGRFPPLGKNPPEVRGGQGGILISRYKTQYNKDSKPSWLDQNPIS